MLIECDWCKEEFNRRPSHISNHNFCSIDCKKRWQEENIKKENHPSWKEGGDIKCDLCGKEFHKKPSHIKENNFCSRECKNKWMSEKMSGKSNPAYNSKKVECDNPGCSDIFKVKKYKRENQDHHFCSEECYHKWTSENWKGKDSPRYGKKMSEEVKKKIAENREYKTGKEHPRWKEGEINYRGSNWEEQRKRVLKRDNQKCQRCKVRNEESKFPLEVHHKIPFREFENYKEANRLSNLITLCKSCHKKVELMETGFTCHHSKEG